MVLIYSGSTHNFIHKRVAEVVHCFVWEVSNFQILIIHWGTMKCERNYENIKIQMGEYHFKTHMFGIEMGGYDIVPSVEWLHKLSLITMDF